MEKTAGGKLLKLSILYSHLTELGGAENVIFSQLKFLRKSGHDVRCHFAYMDEKLTQKSENPHRFTETYLNLPLINSEVINPILSVPLAPFAARNFKKSDALICHGYGPAIWIGYVSKKINRTKYISYIHSPPRFLYLNEEQGNLWKYSSIRNAVYTLSKIGWPLIKKMDFLSMTDSDSILANSIFTALRVKSIYGVKPRLCYPPVDTNTFKPLKKKRNRTKHNWPLILSTGRLVTIKRWDWLIDAMVHVTKTYPSATLAITGKISRENIGYVQGLIQKASSLGLDQRVKFLGFKNIDELVELYNTADVYAYAVPNEDFGLGPVEAMACGTPSVVWNDKSGPCETVIDGRTGFKAYPYDTRDFAEKIMKAIDLDKQSMSDFAHNYVESKFSCGKHLEILEDELRRL
jgi:glycosyltransferase involved in cell wall biosynthesis